VTMCTAWCRAYPRCGIVRGNCRCARLCSFQGKTGGASSPPHRHPAAHGEQVCSLSFTRHLTKRRELPRWRRDGKEILYIDPTGRLMAADVALQGASIEIGGAQPLFTGLLSGPAGFQYDVSPDGQRILAVVPERTASESITIVQNWAAGLKK